MKSNKVGERKPPTITPKHYEDFWSNDKKRLEKLHGHLGEANLLMAKYRQEDTTMLEFAAACKPFADCLQLEFTAFAAIIERTKKGEVYNG